MYARSFRINALNFLGIHFVIYYAIPQGLALTYAKQGKAMQCSAVQCSAVSYFSNFILFNYKLHAAGKGNN